MSFLEKLEDYNKTIDAFGKAGQKTGRASQRWGVGIGDILGTDDAMRRTEDNHAAEAARAARRANQETEGAIISGRRLKDVANDPSIRDFRRGRVEHASTQTNVPLNPIYEQFLQATLAATLTDDPVARAAATRRALEIADQLPKSNGQLVLPVGRTIRYQAHDDNGRVVQDSIKFDPADEGKTAEQLVNEVSRAQVADLRRRGVQATQLLPEFSTPGAGTGTQQPGTGTVTGQPVRDGASQPKVDALVVALAELAADPANPEKKALAQQAAAAHRDANGLHTLPAGKYIVPATEKNPNGGVLDLKSDLIATSPAGLVAMIGNNDGFKAVTKTQGIGAVATPVVAPPTPPAAPQFEDRPVEIKLTTGKGTEAVAKVQVMLEQIGFSTDKGGAKDGVVDGVAGPRTNDAVKKVEQLLKDAGKLPESHKVDGKIDAEFTKAQEAAMKDPKIREQLEVASGQRTPGQAAPSPVAAVPAAPAPAPVAAAPAAQPAAAPAPAPVAAAAPAPSPAATVPTVDPVTAYVKEAKEKEAAFREARSPEERAAAAKAFAEALLPLTNKDGTIAYENRAGVRQNYKPEIVLVNAARGSTPDPVKQNENFLVLREEATKVGMLPSVASAVTASVDRSTTVAVAYQAETNLLSNTAAGLSFGGGQPQQPPSAQMQQALVQARETEQSAPSGPGYVPVADGFKKPGGVLRT